MPATLAQFRSATAGVGNTAASQQIVDAIADLQAGLPDGETLTADGAISLDTAVTFLSALTPPLQVTLAAGRNYQEKLIAVVTGGGVSVVSDPWTWNAGTVGDYLRLVWSDVAGRWLVLDNYVD